jgi:hypothetical protein
MCWTSVCERDGGFTEVTEDEGLRQWKKQKPSWAADTCRSRRKGGESSLTVEVSIASAAADQLVPSSSSGQTQQLGIDEECWNKGFLQHGQTPEVQQELHLTKPVTTSAEGPQLVSTPSCEAPLSLLASSGFGSLHGMVATNKNMDGATSLQETNAAAGAEPQTAEHEQHQAPGMPSAPSAAQGMQEQCQPASLPQGKAGAVGLWSGIALLCINSSHVAGLASGFHVCLQQEDAGCIRYHLC